MEQPDTLGRHGNGLRVPARLVGAGVVGLLAAVLAAPGLLAVLFGAWSLALALIAAIVIGSVAGLALLYRHTGGEGSARRWAAQVTVGAMALAGGGALAWQLSGGTFGRPLVWQAAVAAAFVVCAGAGTRQTRLPAAAVVLTVGLAAATQLGPALASGFEPPTARGCIAATAEEAAARCP